MEIRNMQPEDWDQVAEIYSQGIATGLATFETLVPTYDNWDGKHLAECRFVVEDQSGILGWAALSPVSSRCVYEGVAEVSVYVRGSARGKGVGRLLLAQLIQESETCGLWTLQSGIFPQNSASIRVHEALGFRLIGKRERVAKLHGIWFDNLLFEKRSKIVGLD